MKQSKALIIFSLLVLACFLIPAIYIPTLWLGVLTGKVIVFEILVELAFPFFLYLLLKQENVRIFKSPIQTALMVFTAVSLLSALIGQDPRNSFWGDLQREQGVFLWIHGSLFSAYLFFLFRIQKQWKELISLVVIATASLLSVMSIFEAARIVPTVAPEMLPRASSLVGNPIYFGGFLIIPFFLSLYQAAAHPKHRWYYRISTLLIATGVFMSQTRGAILAILVGLTFWFIFQFKTTKKKILAGLIITICAVGAGSFLLFHKNTNTPRVLSTNDYNTRSRIIFWKYSLKEWAQSPVFGIGPENFYLTYAKYADTKNDVNKYEFPDKPHSQWVEDLTNTGIIGFAAKMSIFILALLALKKRTKDDPKLLFLASALISYFVQNAFVYDTLCVFLMFLFLLNTIDPTEIPEAPTKRKLTGKLFPTLGLLITFFLLIQIQIPTLQMLRASNQFTIDLAHNESQAINSFNHAREIKSPYTTIVPSVFYISLANQSYVLKRLMPREVVLSAIDACKDAISYSPKREQFFYDIVQIYIYDATIRKVPVDDAAKAYTEQFKQLAPHRTELDDQPTQQTQPSASNS